MNETILALLDIVKEEPTPDRHMSSHWKQYAEHVRVERQGETLLLQASGFPTVARSGWMGRGLHWIERATYRRVTSQYRHFPMLWPLADRLAADLGGHADFDVFKSAVILSLLADHWESQGLSPETFAVIGDGPGFLGALIRRYKPGVVLYAIDLPKMLVFQARTTEQASPAVTTRVLHSGSSGNQADVTFVPPDDIESIPGPIDCAINIASMQEMTSSSIQAYFAFLRRRSRPQSRFYCLNRLRKQLPGGEVSEFQKYPWRKDDQIYVDGICPFYRHYLSPRTSSNGPRILGLRLPFMNYFDGDHAHRLVHLASEENI